MSLDLSGINANAYNDYMLHNAKTNAAADQLKSTLTSAASRAKGARTDQDGEAINEELMDACNQFEAYFLEQVFKEMQKSVDALKPESTGSNGQLVDYFKDQTLQDLTKKSTETQGLGFARMLYENMKHTVGMSAADIKEYNERVVAEADQTEAEPSEAAQVAQAPDGAVGEQGAVDE